MEHELDSRASVLRTPYLESRDDSSMRDSEEKPKSGYSGVSMENFSGFFFFFSELEASDWRDGSWASDFVFSTPKFAAVLCVVFFMLYFPARRDLRTVSAVPK